MGSCYRRKGSLAKKALRTKILWKQEPTKAVEEAAQSLSTPPMPVQNEPGRENSTSGGVSPYWATTFTRRYRDTRVSETDDPKIDHPRHSSSV